MFAGLRSDFGISPLAWETPAGGDDLARTGRPSEGRLPSAAPGDVYSGDTGTENAGGVPWWITPPTTPVPTVQGRSNVLYFSADTTVAAGQQYYFAPTDYSIEGDIYGSYGWLQIQSSASLPPPTFINNGLIVARPMGQLTAATVGPSTVQYESATTDLITFVNGPSGGVYCENLLPGGSSAAFYVTAMTRIDNAGLIQAVSSGSAYGIVSAAPAYVTNEETGVIRIWGGDGNAQAMSGGAMDNRGLIEVVGHSMYSSVGLNQTSDVRNSGTIRVYSDDAVQTIGWDIGLLYPSGEVINSGLIEAERAIWFRTEHDSLNNSGVIRGDIIGGGLLVNTGVIEGNLYFAQYTSTVYRGEEGRLDGVIFLGGGASDVRTGDDDDVILGYLTGQITLSTGAGDDIIDLIGGTLTLDAGDGLDLLTFEFLEGGGVDVNLETGVVAGAVTGTALNVEIVVGSGGDDRLTGAAQNDFLIGGLGADQLFGGAGDDFLDGGAGDDLLTPGAGNDLIYGGDGYDVVMLSGSRSDYTVTIREGEVMVKGPEGRDFLYGVELIRFANGDSIDLARQGSAAATHTFHGAPAVADAAFRADLSRLFELAEHTRLDHVGWEPVLSTLADDWF